MRKFKFFALLIFLTIISITNLKSEFKKNNNLDTKPLRIDSEYEIIGNQVHLKINSFNYKTTNNNKSQADEKFRKSIEDYLRRIDDLIPDLPEDFQTLIIEISLPSCFSLMVVNNFISYADTTQFPDTEIENTYIYQPCKDSPYCVVTIVLKKTFGKIYIQDVSMISNSGSCTFSVSPPIDLSSSDTFSLNYNLLPNESAGPYMGPGELTTIYWGLSKVEECTFRCSLDQIPEDKDIPPFPEELSPCIEDIDDLEDICDYPDVDVLKLTPSHPIPDSDIEIEIEVTRVYCPKTGQTRFYIKNVTKLAGELWEAVDLFVINSFVMDYLAKFYAVSNKIYYEYPCFTKDSSGYSLCVPPDPCHSISGYINKKDNGDPCWKYIENQSDDPNLPSDLAYGPENCRPILPGYNEPINSLEDVCGLNCYWHTDGNDALELVPSHFIGPINGDDFIFKTGDLSNNNAKERMRITGTGEFQYSGDYVIMTGDNSIIPSTMGERIRITNDGKVGIGLVPTKSFEVNGESLFQSNLQINGTLRVYQNALINGTIHTKEIIVEDPSLFWPDHVFSEKYKLISLKEIEEFIKRNGHLPQVPSGKEIEKNGLNISQMQQIMMQKIEELTLYMIQLQKENERLQKKLESIEKK